MRVEDVVGNMCEALHAGPFVPSGTAKEALSGGAPTKVMARDIIQQVQRIMCEDWEDVEVAIYVNEDEQWVIRFPLDAVDSDAGLVAYMAGGSLRTGPAPTRR